MRSVNTKVGKLPSNFVELTNLMVARVTVAIRRPLAGSALPPSALINLDETFLLLASTLTRCLAPRGIKKVSNALAGEKRGVTALIALVADGSILPTQVITKGSTPQSAFGPFAMSPIYEESILFCANRDTHWQTVGSLCLYFEKVIVPHGAKVVTAHPTVQSIVVLMDCAPVHVSDRFRSWVSEELNPRLVAGQPSFSIVLQWVPRACTEEATWEVLGVP